MTKRCGHYRVRLDVETQFDNMHPKEDKHWILTLFIYVHDLAEH